MALFPQALTNPGQPCHSDAFTSNPPSPSPRPSALLQVEGPWKPPQEARDSSLGTAMRFACPKTYIPKSSTWAQSVFAEPLNSARAVASSNLCTRSARPCQGLYRTWDRLKLREKAAFSTVVMHSASFSSMHHGCFYLCRTTCVCWRWRW